MGEEKREREREERGVYRWVIKIRMAPKFSRRLCLNSKSSEPTVKT